jgi:hypothetical protein
LEDTQISKDTGHFQMQVRLWLLWSLLPIGVICIILGLIVDVGQPFGTKVHEVLATVWVGAEVNPSVSNHDIVMNRNEAEVYYRHETKPGPLAQLTADCNKGHSVRRSILTTRSSSRRSRAVPPSTSRSRPSSPRSAPW